MQEHLPILRTLGPASPSVAPAVGKPFCAREADPATAPNATVALTPTGFEDALWRVFARSFWATRLDA